MSVSNSTPRALTLREMLRFGVWVGLLGGLAEVAMLILARFGFGRFVNRSLDILWIAPVSLAILSLLVAFPLAALARSRFGARHPALPLGVLCAVAIADAMPALGQVHPLARLLLIAAIALQAGRLTARHRHAVLGLARKSLVPLIVIVAATGIGMRVTLALREQHRFARLSPAMEGAPNVLLLVLDTVRALDLSLYGYARRTSPELDRFAAGGTVFSRAHATSSWTLPSHASLFTGRLPSELRAGWLAPLDGRYPTLAEALAARGFATAGFSANPFYVTRASGLARGFIHFEDFQITPLSVLLGSSIGTTLASSRLRARLFHSRDLIARKNAHQLTRDVLAWLGRRPQRRPFFAFINYFDAHAPYLPPTPFDSAFTGRRVAWSERNTRLAFSGPVSPGQALVERDAYDQAIASQDRAIGELLRGLDRLDLMQNTLIVITADHGEEFGEHGLLDHGFSLNPALLWVPLVIVRPGIPAGPLRVDQPVTLLDLPATILTLADSTHAHALPGRNLFQAPASQSAIRAELEKGIGHPAWYPVSHGPLRSVTMGSWQLVVDAAGDETLMDLATDPAGVLADRTAQEVPVASLRALLDSPSARPPNR